MADFLNIREEVLRGSFGTQALTRGARVVERSGWYQILSPANPTPSRNEVIHSVLTDASADEVIEATMLEYAAIGTPFKWCVSPLTSPIDFGARLERKGFGSWPTRGMYARIADLKISSAPNTSLELVSESNLDIYVDTFLRGWILGRDPTSDEYERLREDMRWTLANLGERAQFFLARVHGEPAGTAGFHLKSKSAYLVGGNVLKKFRGRGLYRSLLSERLRILGGLRQELVTTVARERTSVPILEKFGLTTAYRGQVFQFGGTLPE